jgi:hypothetical protein
MSKAKRKRHSSEATPSPASPNRRKMRLRTGVVVALLACAGAAIAYRLQSRDGGAAPAVASQELLPEAERLKLVGRWRRADANYVLEIKHVAPDGQIDAAYLNPKPIHISKAIAASESGKTTVLVELRDRLYPGSYYTLVYDPRDDRLSGVYHHLGVHQVFDVVFVRM